MNILYIDHYAGSPDMGMEFRPYYLSREWTKMGHKVSIIAGDYSHLRKTNPKVAHDMEKTIIDGIDYYWLISGSYQGNGAARALTMIRFCYKLNKLSGWINSHLRPDVVISSSTYPIDSIPAHKIAYRGDKKAKHIHEVHDMWPSTLIEIGGMSKWNPFVIMMQYGENYAYRHADAVVSLLSNSKEYMIKHGLRNDKFVCVQNGIVKEEWENPEPLPKEHRRALEDLKKSKKFIVGYFGGHALSNCLMPLIRTAEQMQEDNVHFVLIGDGTEKPQLVQYAKNQHIGNITFLPPVNKKAIPTLTEYFDCIYIGAKDSPLYRFGTCMNKMYDGMMAGKPIIFAINAPSTLVEITRCGFIVEPEGTEEIKNSVRKLMKMGENERTAMGRRGKEEILQHYNYENLAEEFFQKMK